MRPAYRHTTSTERMSDRLPVCPEFQSVTYRKDPSHIRYLGDHGEGVGVADAQLPGAVERSMIVSEVW